MGLETILGCKILLGKKMEEVNEFEHYLGTILRKHGSMEGEIRERTAKGGQVMGAQECYEGKKCKHGDKKGNKE